MRSPYGVIRKSTFLAFLFLQCGISGFGQDLSSTSFEQKIDSLGKILPSMEAVADTLESQGILYYRQNDFDIATAYFTHTLQIREDINSVKTNRPLLFLGAIAARREEHKLAISHFKRAMELSIGVDTKSLGQAYNNLGLAYGSINEIDSSLKYHNMSLKLKNSLPVEERSLESINVTLNNLGVTYEKKDDLDSALYYFSIVLEQTKEYEDQTQYAQALSNIGFVNYRKKNFDEALGQYEQALVIAERDSLIDLLANLYDNLFYLHKDLGNDTITYYFEKSLDMQDLIFDLESNKEILKVRAEYDLEKAERELAENQLLLERKEAQTRLVLIVGGSLLLLMSGILLFLTHRQRLIEQLRKKDEAIHNQQVNELIRSQEISVLSARVEGQDMERQRIAEDLHDQLGSKLSAVKLYYDASEGGQSQSSLDKARQLLDETIDETRRIAHNLSSGVLTRFGLVTAIENLKETLENSKQIEIEFIAYNFENHRMSQELEINFYRIIQELISNILKHAKATQISIQLTRHGEGLITLMVEDNGKGFVPEKVSLQSMGLQNLRNRVERFEGNFTIDSKPGHGTTIIVEIDEKQDHVSP